MILHYFHRHLFNIPCRKLDAMFRMSNIRFSFGVLSEAIEKLKKDMLLKNVHVPIFL